jgi:hypothetical protein
MLVHFCFGAKKTTAMILVFDVQSNERKVKNGTCVGTELHENINITNMTEHEIRKREV